jgi:hypothetical protein
VTSRYCADPGTPVVLDEVLYPLTATPKLFIRDAALGNKTNVGLKVGEHMLAKIM